MSILFDFYESPPRDGEEDKKRIYARPVFTDTVGTEAIVEIIHTRSSQSRGDVMSTLTNLSRVFSEVLQNGKRVYLEGIGYFHVTLSCPEIRTKNDMRTDNVQVKSVTFRADKNLKSDLKKVKAKRSDFGRHSARLSPAEIDSKLSEFFKENPVMTRRNFQKICQMTETTALRHIHRLLEEGKIKNIGLPRQPIYVAQGLGEGLENMKA